MFMTLHSGGQGWLQSLRRHHQCTSVWNCRDCMRGCNKRSTLYLEWMKSWVCWQILLDEESDLLTTFITPFGRYCFNRRPFSNFQPLRELLSEKQSWLCGPDQETAFRQKKQLRYTEQSCTINTYRGILNLLCFDQYISTSETATNFYLDSPTFLNLTNSCFKARNPRSPTTTCHYLIKATPPQNILYINGKLFKS